MQLSERLYGRPSRLKIFISSQMRDGVLDDERRAASETVQKLPFAFPWWWEGNAFAGPYCAETVCVEQARSSDGLILILGEQITPITAREYEAARDSGASCYIFIKEGPHRDAQAQEFVERERANGVTRNFRNLSELRALITDAIVGYVTVAWRRDSPRLAARAQRTVAVRISRRAQ